MDIATEPTSSHGGQTGRSSLVASYREPTAADGPGVHDLIARCPPLDPNSLYCNLLQCTHFAGTSVVAEIDGNLAGWVSGYVVPDRPDRLFIWQVAVAPEARGAGLAQAMIRQILDRPACRAIDGLLTSITPGNDSSWTLFRKLARGLGADCRSSLWFSDKLHFAGRHDSEHLLEIAPLKSSRPLSGAPPSA